jgi:hypothetical protein
MAEYEVTIRRKDSAIATVIVVLIILGIIVAFWGDGRLQQNTSDPLPDLDRVNVANLPYVQRRSHCYTSNGQETGPGGKVYTGPSVSMQSTYDSMANEGEKWPEACIAFDTDGLYKTVSGTFFAKVNGAPARVIFRLYADGVLVYESDPISAESAEVSFSVNINNAAELIFAAEGVEDGYRDNLGSITVTVVDATVSK